MERYLIRQGQVYMKYLWYGEKIVDADMGEISFMEAYL